MLLFRRASSAIGARTTTLLPTPVTFAAATWTRSFSATTISLQDSNSSDGDKPLPTTLWPPWKLSDLGWELKLYEEFGPDYMNHPNVEGKALIEKRMASRKTIEGVLRAQLGQQGDAWYEVMKEAAERLQVYEDAVREDFRRRSRELGAEDSSGREQLKAERTEFSRNGRQKKLQELRRQVAAERRNRS